MPRSIGWYNYLYGDNSPGNAMIKKLNPEMTDELLAYSVAKMKEYGIVNSGDSLKNGIGAMTDERMASFFDKMVKAGVVKGDIDYRQAYTLRFVNKARRPRSAAEELSARWPSQRIVRDGYRCRRGVAVRLRGVTKTYDNGVAALGPLDLDVAGRIRLAARAVRLRKIDRAAADRGAERADVGHGRRLPSRQQRRRGGTRSASCSRSRP